MKQDYVTKKIRFYLNERDILKNRWALMAEYNGERWAIIEWDGDKPSRETVELCMKVALRSFDYGHVVLRTIEHVTCEGYLDEKD